MNYCPKCGAPTTNAPFCANCGHRLDASTPDQAVEPDASRGEAPGATGGAGPSDAEPASGPRTSMLPKTNPFADIAIVDYARDAGALILLLVSFGLPWDGDGDVTSKVYVILATLLSVASLSLPYLSRAGVFPPAFTADQQRLARLGANVPYAAIVLITLILDYTEANDGLAGVGVGTVFGLAGVFLAAQPRTPERVAADGPLWRMVILAIGGVIVLTSLLTTLIQLADIDADGWEPRVSFVLFILMFLTVVALPLYGFYTRDSGWRDVIVLLGATGIVFGFWQLSADLVSDWWAVRNFGPMTLFWPALAAAVTAVGMHAYVNVPRGAARWVQSVTRAFELVAIVAVFGVLLTVVDVAAIDIDRGAKITVMVGYLMVVAAAAVGRGALRKDAAQGRPVALIVAGVVVVLAIVIAAVAPDVALGVDFNAQVLKGDAAMLSMLFVFAAAIVAMLTGPPEVREGLAVVSGRATATTGPTDRPAAPAAEPARPEPDVAAAASAPTPSAPSAPTASGYTAQIASDPATPLETLADIAAKEPSLRPYVAANPSTYPELLQWLGNLGDPAVNEALRGRG